MSNVALTVHSGGKLLPQITDNVERLPILVPQGQEDQLLGVLYLGRGTGEKMATAVLTSTKS